MTATRYVREGTLAVLEIDNPPVNALSGPVISGLIEGFDKFETDEDAAALVLRCRGRTFVAGATSRCSMIPRSRPPLSTIC